jgi:hypothetical protein
LAEAFHRSAWPRKNLASLPRACVGPDPARARRAAGRVRRSKPETNSDLQSQPVVSRIHVRRITDIGVANVHLPRRTSRRHSLSPNILRAKVSREKKKPDEPVKSAAKTADVPAPSQTNLNAAFARFIPDYPALIDTFRDRSEELEIARLELDRIAGLTDGYSGKLCRSGFENVSAWLRWDQF